MSKSEEEYLEALYTLTQNNKHATTGEVAGKLKIRPASVTEMFEKLAKKGYVIYSPYRGVRLTEEGYKYGKKIVRKHRLLERFLHDVLKIGKNRVHEYACEMEHGLSDEAERVICKTLKQSDTCPDDEQHIPPCDFEFSNCQECQQFNSEMDEVKRRKENLVALSSLKEAEVGRVVFIRGGKGVVQRLYHMGLTPGTEVKVLRAAPFGGPIQVEVRGTSLAVGWMIANKIFVEIKN